MVEKIIAKLAELAASVGAETASLWNNYQPVEPDNLKK